MFWTEAERRIQEAIKQQSVSLDLSGLELTEISNAIGQLVNLQSLDLQQNQLNTIPDVIGQLVNLQSLDLQQNQLNTIPDVIGQLVNLQSLDLHKNQLNTIPNVIGQLVNLQSLDLQQNQLNTIPNVIGQLVNLQSLDLHKNQLNTIPNAIGQLVNLQSLDLQLNQLNTIPDAIGQLANLQTLNLYGNQLTTTPDAVGQLKNLQKLDLGSNQLNTIPDAIGQLVNLQSLDLDENQLATIPDAIGQLANLQTLNLDRNQLATIPDAIGQLANLQELYLHGNSSLKIPVELLGPKYGEVHFGNAKPAKPQNIIEYLFRIQKKAQPLNEAKLILVGYGAVGKTSLVNRLVHQTFDAGETKTEGIQITDWPLFLNGNEDVNLNVWDFGGQEIMHSTHQFFLTERSLYLLVLNGRQGHEDADAEYWLELIQSFGGNSPVIVVLNKVKEHPFDVNRSGLKQKFPNIKDFIRTDCKTEHGLDELSQVIERETDRLENLRDSFPSSWFAIKQQLAGMKENYIPFEKYRNICGQNDEPDQDSQDKLAFYLHNLGIALNYKDDPRLRDTNILNPLWVTNGIYKILNAHNLADHKGELDLSCLTQLLDSQKYPRERHGFLMELMRKFELCFPFQDRQDRYLIPDLLDKQQPPEAEGFILEDCLNFRYEYPILPEGLLPRFIVRTNVLSSNPMRWHTGVILDFEGNRALVKADQQDRSVTISINGPQQGRRRLLAIIRSDFERIHSSFKSKPEEKVPIPNHPHLSLTYDDLLVMEKQGLTEVPMVINGKVIQININELLDGVDLGQPHQAAKDSEHSSGALKLFYSYSHTDETLRDQLSLRLKIFQRNGLIQSWYDRQIPAGAKWEEELDRNLEQADIILLLLSPDFIASDYCYEVELERALERAQSNKSIVISILLRPVNQKSPLLKHIFALQALPRDLKPVTQWKDSDNAWLNIEQELEQLILDRTGFRP
ncbi:COR domain-containing protein [Acaryochloris marina]|uniref:leucine-rich repeat domain-containing protein n=1 Tax=Acaryochloris marina TaxID=155978 RepID=UPI001BB036C0|nr:COR domain-containing protein [Acaryochloris marina]QUY41747.1 leucine-rich repeat domain-containing protein [Acaryochloris marina S15]